METTVVAEQISGTIAWADGLGCDCGFDITEWTIDDVYVSPSTDVLYMYANCECGKQRRTLDVSASRELFGTDTRVWLNRAVRVVNIVSRKTYWELTIEDMQV